MNALTRWWAAVLGAQLLLGCAAQLPAPVLLTLPVAMGSTSHDASPPDRLAPGPGPVLAVRRVGIPEYLVSRRVRYRTDASTLAEWPNTYWAERVEIGVSRAFLAALREHLVGWTVCESGCGEQNPALVMQVELVSMDYLRSVLTLQAQARVVLSGPGASGKLQQSKEFFYTLTAGTDDAQAQAKLMGEVIDELASAAAPLVRAASP